MYKRFEALMNAKGVTAYRVSKDTGISTSTLSEWKNERYVPKVDKLIILANYFGVTLEYLIYGK